VVERKPNDTLDDPIDVDAYRSQVLILLKNEKTMVLAVHSSDGPWIAPVYFLYAPPGVYFYSSPRSKHIQALDNCSRAAGAIYADGNQWQDIRGLQMIGTAEQVQSKLQRLNITTQYLAKFPLAGKMLSAGAAQNQSLEARVGLYVFWPLEIHCTFNRQGFGRRVPIGL
jgi:uncharacterized protein YhbP (UPF0306 family)